MIHPRSSFIILHYSAPSRITLDSNLYNATPSYNILRNLAQSSTICHHPRSSRTIMNHSAPSATAKHHLALPLTILHYVVPTGTILHLLRIMPQVILVALESASTYSSFLTKKLYKHFIKLFISDTHSSSLTKLFFYLHSRYVYRIFIFYCNRPIIQ